MEYEEAKELFKMVRAVDDDIVLSLTRKVWKPSNSATLVVTIPPNRFYSEGDEVEVSLTSKGRVIISPPK